MSCDLVTFPFFGAFAPCSDKQLKKQTNIKHSDEQSLPRDLWTDGLRPSSNSVAEWGAGIEVGHRAEQGRSGCKPHPKRPGMV